MAGEGSSGLTAAIHTLAEYMLAADRGPPALHHHVKTDMSAPNPPPPVAPIPEHLHTVTPRLVLSGAAEAIEFYRRAFGAEEVGERFTGPDGVIIHAELRIGDSIVMINDDAGDSEARERPPRSLSEHVSAIMVTYWENVDAAWERAVEVGAEVVYPLADQFYGERGGRLRDPYGQQWMLSQRTEDLSHEEIARRAARFFAADA
jgi:PhnB protein